MQNPRGSFAELFVSNLGLYTESVVFYFCSGVVTVDVKLDFLEIQQCPGDHTVANAFKNTARCHFKTQYVSSVYLLSIPSIYCIVQTKYSRRINYSYAVDTPSPLEN